MDPKPNPIEILTSTPPKASVIWLHGLGADGHDFVPLVPALELQSDLALRFIFPHAPRRPVTINGGMVMRAWYDIYDTGFTSREDEDGIRDAAGRVDVLIRQEMERGIPPQRITLAGFSQGGAVALHCGLRCPHPLAGIIALSCYLPLAGRLAEEQHRANHQTPILMIHGSRDTIVPPALAQTSRGMLEQLGHPLEWHEFPMGHEVSAEEIAVIAAWLGQRLLESRENGNNK